MPFWPIDTGMAALLILLTVVDERPRRTVFGIVPEAVGPLREAFGGPDDHEQVARSRMEATTQLDLSLR